MSRITQRSRRALGILVFSFAGTASAQESATIFDAPIVATGSYDCFRGVGDFDGDGYADAIGCWISSSDLKTCSARGYRNLGNGALSQVWSVYPLASQTMNAPTYVPMTVADFNLDGLCDFAVGVGDMVYVVTSAGLATPIIYQSWGSAEVRKILAADLDQDGRPDLAILTPSVLEIRRNTPQHGTWQFVFSASHSTTAGADELRPIDCDGDGCVDLMAASPTNLTMYSVVGAQFTALQVYSHSQANPKIDSGDIDNDGDVDATIFGNGTYQIARRIGTAAFNVEPQQTGGIARFLVDFDQDGDLDGICCGGGGSSIPDNTAQSTFLFSVNKGNGNFAPSWKVPGLGSERVAGFVDLDHDGDIDIVAGRCVYYLRGPLLAPPNAKLPSSAGGESYVVDIDGDGDPDIFTGFNGYSRNLGNGQFILASSITPTPPPNHIYVGPGFIGDFDGDGNPDNNIQDYFSNYSNAGGACSGMPAAAISWMAAWRSTRRCRSPSAGCSFPTIHSPGCRRTSMATATWTS